MNKEELQAMRAEQELKIRRAEQEAAMSGAQTRSTPRTPGKSPEKRNMPAMPRGVAKPYNPKTDKVDPVARPYRPGTDKVKMLKAKLDSLSKRKK